MTIKISVCVITYNHSRYIKDCLDGLAQQELEFPIEIIIRDDCSTDNTLSIIQEFINNNKNSNINYKLLDGSVNIGANKNILTIISESSGDYIAFCEGDDYWIDPHKLSKQYNQAVKHIDCSFFVHPAYYLYSDGVLKKNIWPINNSQKKNFNVNDILASTWQFAPTCSYFIKRSALMTLPSWFTTATIGDVYIEMYAAKKGIVVLDEYMSVYRYMAAGSWSEVNSADRGTKINKVINHYENFNNCLNLAKKDFPENIRHIDNKIANNDFQLSLLYLKCGDKSKFKEKIVCSKKKSITFSFKRKLFYLFKNSPKILLFFIELNERRRKV